MASLAVDETDTTNNSSTNNSIDKYTRKPDEIIISNEVYVSMNTINMYAFIICVDYRLSRIPGGLIRSKNYSLVLN